MIFPLNWGIGCERRKAYPSGRLGQPRRVAARLSAGARVPGSRGFGTDPSLATLGKVPQTGLSSKTKRLANPPV